MRDLVYKFVRHCMTDDEFRCGGIPTRESYYLKKLGWDEATTNKFYEAMCTIKFMNDDENRREEERASEKLDRDIERLDREIERLRKRTEQILEKERRQV